MVRRVNVFWQSANGHLYGRLPEWIRRCRASELESLNGWMEASASTKPANLLSDSAYLAASFAHVGLLPRMDPHMDGEGGPLDERFPTSFFRADMGSVTTVDSLVSSQVASTCKALPARGTGKGLRCGRSGRAGVIFRRRTRGVLLAQRVSWRIHGVEWSVVVVRSEDS